MIYNIDEKGVVQNHTPPAVVAGTYFHPPSVVSKKGQTTTMIECGSASGVAVPPLLSLWENSLFLMKNSSPGADGMMSDSGLVNTNIFRYYMQHHLTKFLPQRDSEQHLLIILDGRKSHISLYLVEWTKRQTSSSSYYQLIAHTFSNLLMSVAKDLFRECIIQPVINSCEKHQLV